MDWALVIQKNREALMSIIATLFAQAGLVPPCGLRIQHPAVVLSVRSTGKAAFQML